MSKYRDQRQQEVVIAGVRALLDLADRFDVCEISLETLELIADSYMELVDPQETPGGEENQPCKRPDPRGRPLTAGPLDPDDHAWD